MAFFFNQTKQQAATSKSKSKRHIPIDTMRAMGCKACPLDKDSKIESPKIPPEGDRKAEVYILGEGISAYEDDKGRLFTDELSRQVLKVLPRDFSFQSGLRVSHITRCLNRKSEDGKPEFADTECCRGYIEKDIEETKPLLIIGLGPSVLTWASQLPGGITKWRGRVCVIQIGSHTCYFYPVYSPEHVLDRKGKYGKSEIELVFENDIKEAVKLLDDYKKPKVHKAPYDTGVQVVTSENSNDLDVILKVLEELKTEPSVGIDLETSGLRPYSNTSAIYTMAIGTYDRVIAFPYMHPKAAWSRRQFSILKDAVLDYLMFSNTKVAHNLGFEMEWLGYFFGDRILRLTEWEDTLFQAHTIDERPGKSLDELTRLYFGFFLKEQSKVDAARILEYPLKDVLRYNGMDSKWCHALYLEQKHLIEKNAKYVYEYERKIRLQPTLTATQLIGIPADIPYAKNIEVGLEERVVEIQNKINRCKEVGLYRSKYGPFDPGSTDSVLKLMKDVLHREEVKTKDGKFTTDEEALNSIPAREVPSAPLILELRTVTKLLSTYVEPITKGNMVSDDGHIHTRYSSHVAETGRLASEDPNLQNFPKRKNKEIRGVFSAPAGQVIVSIDYGQIEARVFGMASNDKNLCKALWTDFDIHGHWADRFLKEYPAIKDWIIHDYKVPGDDDKLIRKTLRNEAKNGWVFPLFFGSHQSSVARSMHLPDAIAEDLVAEFWDEYEGVKKWQERTIARYEKNLYVETLNGRRRRGALSKNQIINTPIQGSAADIVTAGMNAVSELSMRIERPELTPRLNIHDDLTFVLNNETKKDDVLLIATEMCRPRFDWVNVPLIIEVSEGIRWHESKEVAVYKSSELFNLTNPFIK